MYDTGYVGVGRCEVRLYVNGGVCRTGYVVGGIVGRAKGSYRRVR